MALYEISVALLMFLVIVAGTGPVAKDTRPETCNVVCDCGLGQKYPVPAYPRQENIFERQGQKGEMGPIGPKGEKGSQGSKGKNADPSLKSDILGAISAKSCKELADQHGITTAGHYLMKSPAGGPAYTYCDFRLYDDAATCEELQGKHSIFRAGYYRFGRSSKEGNTYQFCHPVFRGVYTCQRLKTRHGITESGLYLFTVGHLTPFQVYCNFTSGTAVTEVRHNLMREIQIPDCEDAGCYVGMPLYDVGATDIRRIIDNSVSCKQFIKLRCRGVLITWKGSPRSWWTSSSGEQMGYWGGTRRKGYCACGETNSCIDKTKKCNCDNNSRNIVTSDEGYLDDKTKLPIKEIRVGDMGDPLEIAWHTIGKLECVGQV